MYETFMWFMSSGLFALFGVAVMAYILGDIMSGKQKFSTFEKVFALVALAINFMAVASHLAAGG